jgi:hypothetical protein
MNRKDTEQALHAELSRYTDIEYDFGRSSKHPHVLIRCGDKTRKVTYSGTPTERRAILNNLADIRRAVREVTS